MLRICSARRAPVTGVGKGLIPKTAYTPLSGSRLWYEMVVIEIVEARSVGLPATAPAAGNLDLTPPPCAPAGGTRAGPRSRVGGAADR